MVERLLERKPALFSATACIVIGILAIPVIIPHMLHGYHMLHITLHIAGLTLATFITILAAGSYHRTKSRRMQISFVAFACFVFSEIVLLIDTVWPFLTTISPLPLQEIGHLLVFSALGLLALAVFRND